MPPNAPLLRGREPLKSFYTDLVTKVSDMKLEPGDIAGHGPIAYKSGTYTMNIGATRDRGKFLFVLRNMAGNWRLDTPAGAATSPGRRPTSGYRGARRGAVSGGRRRLSSVPCVVT